MGVIRFLLAFAVIISHNVTFFGLTFTGSINAVQGFYVISGFYMGLILNEKYSPKQYFLFISNRLLRLLPIYWVLVGIMIVLSIVWRYCSHMNNTLFFDNFFMYPSLQPLGWMLVVFADVFVFLQDLMLFLGVSENGGLEFVSNFRTAREPLAQLLIIPQAWTVGLEMTFYLLVPFLIRLRTVFIIGIALLSLSLRFYAYNKGLNFEPWTYRFFPFELFFFLLGLLSFRFYKVIVARKLDMRIGFFLFHLLWIYIVTYQFMPLSEFANKVLFLGLLACSLPFIFERFKKSRFDRFIGEFSYPVYLSHMLVLIIAGVLNTKFFHLPPQAFDLLSIVCVLIFSFCLIRFVSEPVEKFRQKRVLINNSQSQTKSV